MSYLGSSWRRITVGTTVECAAETWSNKEHLFERQGTIFEIRDEYIGVEIKVWLLNPLAEIRTNLVRQRFYPPRSAIKAYDGTNAYLGFATMEQVVSLAIGEWHTPPELDRPTGA